MAGERGARDGVRNGSAGEQDDTGGERWAAGLQGAQHVLSGDDRKVQIADDEVDAAVARVVAGQELGDRRLAITGFGDRPELTLKPALQCEADAWLVVNDQYAGQLTLQNHRKGKSERVFVVTRTPVQTPQ